MNGQQYVCKCNKIRAVDLSENPSLANLFGTQCGECIMVEGNCDDETFAKYFPEHSVTNTSVPVINKISRKVVIKLTGNVVVWGLVYLAENERLSDILNDDRKFLPVARLIDNQNDSAKQGTMVINKDTIKSIEEVYT